jgi:hypothetical protein
LFIEPVSKPGLAGILLPEEPVPLYFIFLPGPGQGSHRALQGQVLPCHVHFLLNGTKAVFYRFLSSNMEKIPLFEVFSWSIRAGGISEKNIKFQKRLRERGGD